MTKKPTVTISRELFDLLAAFLDEHEYCDNRDEYFAACRSCGLSSFRPGQHNPIFCEFLKIVEHPDFKANR
jgi:hypothetical protein